MSHKRQIFIINPNFQMRFCIYVCTLLVVSSIVYPITISNFIQDIATHASKISPDLGQNLQKEWKDLTLLFWLWQAGITGIVFVICIFISHRVAGPLYKAQKHLAQIKNGGDPGKLFFRKGDYFPELATSINDTFGTIQENYKNDFVYISEVNAYLKNLSMVVPEDKKIVLNEIAKKLTEIQNRFSSS